MVALAVSPCRSLTPVLHAGPFQKEGLQEHGLGTVQTVRRVESPTEDPSSSLDSAIVGTRKDRHSSVPHSLSLSNRDQSCLFSPPQKGEVSEAKYGKDLKTESGLI